MTVADVLEVLLAFDDVLATCFGVTIAAWLVSRVISWFVSAVNDVR